jgi:4-hydroxy-tetrahydrodipicolinate synthase
MTPISPPQDRGVYPVLYALFDDRGALDRRAMIEQAEICLAMGADGLVVLGLATEVRALEAHERRQLVEWLGPAIGGRVPFVVTVFGDTAGHQIDDARHAADHGATWLIFQPPGDAAGENDLRASFGQVLASSPLPAAVQNAPQFIGHGLSVDSIIELANNHSALRTIKQEVSAVETADLVNRLADRLSVFSGRGGIELIDGYQAGAKGHIPAPEYADLLIDIWRRLEAGDIDCARSRYAHVLPLATFVLQSIDDLLTYGKWLFCRRFGLPYRQRQRRLQPSQFGLARLADHAAFAGIDLPPDRSQG